MWRRSLPVVEPLDADQLDRVDATVTTLLQDVGLRITEPRLLKLLRDAGLAAEGDLVRFDRAFVDEQDGTERTRAGRCAPLPSCGGRLRWREG